jgi:hypothetical protein
MKIIKNKLNNTVLYAGIDLILDDDGLKSKKLRAPNIKLDDYDLIEVDNLPKNYKGGMYTYDSDSKTWDLTEQGVTYITDLLQEKKSEKLTKLSKYNTNFIENLYTLPIQQSFQNFYVDNTLTDEKKNFVQGRINLVWNWIKTILIYYYTKKQEIINTATIEQLDDINWDYSSFEDLNPQVELSEFMNDI